MMYKVSIYALFHLIPLTAALVANTGIKQMIRFPVHSMAKHPEDDGARWMLFGRRQILRVVAGAAALLPTASFADVSDGTSLPEGAAQFNRVIRMKRDLQVM
jgi:hypothetical protein